MDEWTFTNGQEGFGLLAAGRVGRHGEEGSFWNNSYMAVCGRVEYRLDPETGAVVTNSVYPLISMKLGIGAQEKLGVTRENLPDFEAGRLDTLRQSYLSRMVPLELSCGERGQGSYNLFAGETSGKVVGTVEDPLTEVVLRLRRNAAGYEIACLDPQGAVIGVRQFTAPEAPSALDPDHIYVGLFAARSCRVTFQDVTLTVTEAGEEAAAPARQKTVPTCRVLSSHLSNHAAYTLKVVTNADGTLLVDAPQQERRSIPVRAMEPAAQDLLLVSGENPLQLLFVPEPGGLVREGAETMEVVDRPLSRTFTVRFEPPGRADGKTLHVSPSGGPDGLGTAASPIDVETALRRVRPGDEILLQPGVYRPGRKLQVERDVSGLPGRPIRMCAPAGERAVFDFEKKSPGFVCAGSYWEIEGIHCMHSADFTPGLQLSGHDIHLHRSWASENGEGGIVIWTLLDTDTREGWPHDIQVTCCISWNNADPGSTNADGFAAKLTVGPGIVFDRCISCYNADDGWDLFTKVELGTTSPVVIKNSVAFGNGYHPSGHRRGYGNGFKLGGTSLPGGHFLYRCAAWHNAGKGIDSNTAPDGQIKACTSFDNDGPNVALYTSDGKNTAYAVYGLVSLRRDSPGPDDLLQPRGAQDLSQLSGPDCFYWTGGRSANATGLVFAPSWFASLDWPRRLSQDPDRLLDETGSLRLGQFLRLTKEGETALRTQGADPRNAAAPLHETATPSIG